MSWELIMMPLGEVAADNDGWQWFTSLPIAGLPAERPASGHRLTVGDAVEALRNVGVRGSCWPGVAGVEPFLLEPDPSASGTGWGIGEVTFHADGRGLRELAAPTDAIKAIGLNKPDPASALTAACAIAGHGPLVVFDPNMHGVAIAEGASPGDVEQDWPW